MIRERGLISVSIITIAVFFASLMFVFEDSSAVLAANVTMEFSVREQYADVLPDEYTMVQYEGVVSTEVVSLPANQVMEIALELENENIDYIFDPSSFMVTQENVGQEFPFILNVYVDTGIQSGQNILGAYAFYSYSPGMIGGRSSTTDLVLLVGQYMDGDVTGPGSVEVEEGSTGEVEVTVFNTGNTWTEYDLLVEGGEKAGLKGIDLAADKVYDLDLYFGTSKALPIGIDVRDINGDTSVMITFTLLDHDTGNEYSSHSLMINAVEKQTPGVPDGPNDDGDTTPIDDGESDPRVPENTDEGTGEPSEGPIAQGSTSMSAVWFIVPAALLLMLTGIGSYVWIAKRKRGING